MKNILYVIDTRGPGGAERIFLDLICGIDKTKYNPVILIKGQGWLDNELRSNGFETIIINPKGSFNFRYLWSLIKIIKKYKVELIHSHLLGSNIYASAAGLLTGIPVISTFHGAVDVKQNERFRWLKFQIINMGSSWIVTVSDHLKSQLWDISNISRKKTIIIYNGINLEKYQRINDKTLRKELNITDETILIGAVGNIRRPKSYDVLMNAAAILHKETDNYKFVIAGEGSGSIYDELVELQSKLDLKSNVYFIGFRPDVARIMSNMDIFLLTSESEGFSLSTIEAMACELPVIATRSGGPEEIITDGIDGLLVNTNSPAQIANAIRKLTEDKQLRENIIKNATRLVKEKYTTEKMLNNYDAVYQQVL